MTVLRLQTSIQYDSEVPRDVFQINPVFSVGFDISDPLHSPEADTLCSDWATAFLAWTAGAGSPRVEVKSYDVEGTKPVYPNGSHVLEGSYRASTVCRELAVCLSFKGGQGPRKRGRLYLPLALMQTGTAVPLRPDAATRQKAGDLAGALQALGGTNVDWGVWSGASHAFTKATSWWVDDEWDIQRRRGLRANQRLTGTTSE